MVFFSSGTLEPEEKKFILFLNQKNSFKCDILKYAKRF